MPPSEERLREYGRANSENKRQAGQLAAPMVQLQNMSRRDSSGALVFIDKRWSFQAVARGGKAGSYQHGGPLPQGLAHRPVCGESHRHKSWCHTEMAASDRSAPALEEPRGDPYGQLRSNTRRREGPTMLISEIRGSSSLASAGCLASARG